MTPCSGNWTSCGRGLPAGKAARMPSSVQRYPVRWSTIPRRQDRSPSSSACSSTSAVLALSFSCRDLHPSRNDVNPRWCSNLQPWRPAQHCDRHAIHLDHCALLGLVLQSHVFLLSIARPPLRNVRNVAERLRLRIISACGRVRTRAHTWRCS